jgi:hypothetical protein
MDCDRVTAVDERRSNAGRALLTLVVDLVLDFEGSWAMSIQNRLA